MIDIQAIKRAKQDILAVADAEDVPDWALNKQFVYRGLGHQRTNNTSPYLDYRQSQAQVAGCKKLTFSRV